MTEILPPLAIALFVSATTLQLADLVTTLRGLHLGLGERNSRGRWLIERIGAVRAVLVIKLFAIACGAVIYWLSPAWASAILLTLLCAQGVRTLRNNLAALRRRSRGG